MDFNSELAWPAGNPPPGAHDPAVAWQVARDLAGSDTWPQIREQTPTTGWCAKLLSHRNPDGLWGGGLYSPKWISTFYTLQTLAALGLSADEERAVSSTQILLDRGIHDDGQVSLWNSGTPDVCVAGMLLRTAASFSLGADPRLHLVRDRLLQQRLPDGGWNCRRGKNVSHSSFHTTLSVLEGLASLGEIDQDGAEFLLRHRLFRSHLTGEVVHPGLLSFSFPRYWYYDILRVLHYFATIRAALDPRMNDAIEVVRSKRDSDGWWRPGRQHTGQTWLQLEPARQPSALITLDALRVLRWWTAPRERQKFAAPKETLDRP